jgi:hypothetical protein
VRDAQQLPPNGHPRTVHQRDPQTVPAQGPHDHRRVNFGEPISAAQLLALGDQPASLRVYLMSDDPE